MINNLYHFLVYAFLNHDHKCDCLIGIRASHLHKCHSDGCNPNNQSNYNLTLYVNFRLNKIFVAIILNNIHFGKLLP